MNIFQQLAASGFYTVDLIIVIGYLAVLIALGLFLGRSKKGHQKSANDYFLAGNTLTWWAVGASLIAANISAEQFIGMSGTSYADGIATAAYELMAAVTLVVIGKFLLPTMLKQKIFTIPQFLRERYNNGVRSEEHTSELQSPDHLVCRLLLEKKRWSKTSATHFLTRRHTCTPRSIEQTH